jgi:hypothetical protein
MSSSILGQPKPPIWIWALSVGLGLARLQAFFWFVPPTRDAQWQLALIPLWVIDLPFSFVYYFVIPGPFAEQYLGPIWWALIPVFLWKISHPKTKSIIDHPT